MYDEVIVRYPHPEHGELLVKAWVLSKGDVRIHAVQMPGFWGAWVSLKFRGGVYYEWLTSNFSENPLENVSADLANNGVFDALLAQECLALAKRYAKAATRLEHLREV